VHAIITLFVSVESAAAFEFVGRRVWIVKEQWANVQTTNGLANGRPVRFTRSVRGRRYRRDISRYVKRLNVRKTCGYRYIRAVFHKIGKIRGRATFAPAFVSAGRKSSATCCLRLETIRLLGRKNYTRVRRLPRATGFADNVYPETTRRRAAFRYVWSEFSVIELYIYVCVCIYPARWSYVGSLCTTSDRR